MQVESQSIHGISINECLYFITEDIKIKANQRRSKTNCPYCREILHLAPSDYPVCRMAADFQRELDKLDVAVKNSKKDGNNFFFCKNTQFGFCFCQLLITVFPWTC